MRQKLKDFPGAIADYQETMRLQLMALSFEQRSAIQSQIITLQNAISEIYKLRSPLGQLKDF